MRNIFAATLIGLCLVSCAKKPVIEKEKYVVLHYRGTLADGSEFDSSQGGEPLAFICGAGLMIPGFEAGIAGLRAGEKKTITVKAKDAYGDYDQSRLFPVSREHFPPGFVFETGLQILIETTAGPLHALIADIMDTEILVDCNPPLAGKDLTFEVEILEVRDPTEEERSL